MTSVDANDSPVTDESLAEFDRRVEVILGRLAATMHKKQESYGRHNLYRRGLLGMIVRTEDKIERLVHMDKQGATASADGDSMRDAMQDIGGYAVMMQVWAEDMGLLGLLEPLPDTALGTRTRKPRSGFAIMEEAKKIRERAFTDITGAMARESAGISSTTEMMGAIRSALDTMYGELAVAFGQDTGGPSHAPVEGFHPYTGEMVPFADDTAPPPAPSEELKAELDKPHAIG